MNTPSQISAASAARLARTSRSVRALTLLGAAPRRIGNTLAPFVDLLLRLWLAEQFLFSGLLKLADWDTALRLAEYEYPVSWMDPVSAATLGVAIEIVGPLLLAPGLATRLAALPLLALSLVIQLEYRALNAHLFWSLLLAWYVVRGAGALSLDRWLANGVGDTALPGVRTFGRLYAALDRWAAPAILLGLRLAVALLVLCALRLAGAAAPLPTLLDPAPLTALLSVQTFTESGELLAATPALGALPRAALAGAAVLLALGLATRIAAIVVAAVLYGYAATVGVSALQAADLWGLTLIAAVVAVSGAGALSLDALLQQALRRRPTPRADDTLPHVVIVGAGFGGVAAARALRHAPCRVTLIDQRNYHLFQPLLYQVASASLSPADIAAPVRELFRDQPNVTVRMARVTGVERARREVIAGTLRIGYDYLVLATGARHSYFGKDAWEPYAPGLKQIEDATEVRRRLLLAFERAENAADPVERDAQLTFAIVGGGPTGVELAGAIVELARHGMRGEFRRIDPAQARVLLVQSAPRLLPAMHERSSAATLSALRALGVEVLLDSRVEAVDADGLTVNGRRIAARTVLWAAGVAASPAASWLGVEADRAGRIKVGADLSVPDTPEVFAIGDTACAEAWNGQVVPGLAPAAKQAGQYVARVLRARIEGRAPPPSFAYRHLGSLATIGRKAAVADFGRMRLSGPIAWWFWGAVHVLFLAGMRSRVAVALEWFWAYLTFRRSTRLITEPAAAPTL